MARHSESELWEGLDGERGVFLATYAEYPIGTPVELTVHLPHTTFVSRATVKWIRPASPTGTWDGSWPGLGLELENLSTHADHALSEFAEKRPSLFR